MPPRAPVGIFQAAARTATLSTIVRFAFSGIFSPIISSLHAQGDRENGWAVLYKDISRWIFTGAFAYLPRDHAPLQRDTDDLRSRVSPSGWRQARSRSSWSPSPSSIQRLGGPHAPHARDDRQPERRDDRHSRRRSDRASRVSLSPGSASPLRPEYRRSSEPLSACPPAIVTENTATLLAVRRRLGFWPYNLGVAEAARPPASSPPESRIWRGGRSLSLPAIPTIAILGAIFGHLLSGAAPLLWPERDRQRVPPGFLGCGPTSTPSGKELSCGRRTYESSLPRRART